VIGISDRRVRLVTVAIGVAGLIAAATTPAGAQDISVNFAQGSGLTERVIQMIALLTVLSLAPSILVMMTSFTRIVVVLSLLRTALGTATAPPNAVIVSLALFLTAFVMGPALQKAYDTGVRPLVANEITAEQAFERSAVPLRAFMQKNVSEKDLKLFVDMSKEAEPTKPEDISLRVLVPAFMISELKRAFEIGFLLFLPFLIIDLVVASVLMSMGMMMLPPVVVSLPFNLIFFVLVELFTVFYSQIPEHMEHYRFLFAGLHGYDTIANWMTVSAFCAVAALVLLINPRTRENESLLAVACACVFLSLWIEKGLGLIVTGFVPSPLEKITRYTPTGPEIAITLGVWALGFLIITVLYKIFISVRREEAG